jgi:hypothetical protein
MQAVIIQRRIESLPTLSRSGKRINGLHRLMRSPYLFERAYEKVSLNKGALTPGVADEARRHCQARSRWHLSLPASPPGLHPEGQRQDMTAGNSHGGRPARSGGGQDHPRSNL